MGEIALVLTDGRAVLGFAAFTEGDMQKNPGVSVDQNAIARRAYEIYVGRGRQDGHDMEDWLRAEKEIRDQQRVPTQQSTTARTVPLKAAKRVRS